jgi:hypothetical protein
MSGRKRKAAKDIHVTPVAIKEEKETKANEPVEKKRKVTKEPRFIITMLTRCISAGEDSKLEFCRTEIQNKPGRFSLLIRGEENAYKRAIYWLQEVLTNEKIEADHLFKQANKEGWTNKKLFAELHELVQHHFVYHLDTTMECRVTPCVSSTESG